MQEQKLFSEVVTSKAPATADAVECFFIRFLVPARLQAALKIQGPFRRVLANALTPFATLNAFIRRSSVFASAVQLFSMEGEEGILEDVVGYIYASGLAVIARGTKVDAGKDTGIFDFIESRREARKRTGHSE